MQADIVLSNQKEEFEITQPLFIFPEEEEMYKKLSSVFENRPLIKESIGNSNFKLFNDGNDQNEISSQDDFSEDNEEKNLNTEEQMEIYYDHYPTIYGYYQYYQGTTGRRIHKDNKINESNYKYNDDYNKKNIHDNPKDYSEYYNNKYGLKIRKMDLGELNDKINNNDDINHQYWKNRKKDKNGQYIDPKIFKFFQKDENVQIDNANADDGNIQKVFISGLINKISKLEKNEEDEEDNSPNSSQKPQISNSVIKSFISKNFINKLDDLNQLLLKSTKYQNALSSVKPNQKYIDEGFIGNEYNIYGFGERKDYTLEELKNLPWLSPETFIKTGPIKIYDEIHSNDIHQGGLGDCYFLAAISSIAEYPQRLERLFLTKDYNKNGIYVVALCINGIWQDVVLDDTFPCTKYSQKPAFNRTKSGELWVMILEKAWAKTHGGYMNIAAGLTREALRDLTGASAKTYFTGQNREELWDRLREANDKRYIMTAGSDNLNNGSDSYVEKIGIAGSHAYSLLEAVEILKLGDDRYRCLKEGESSFGKNIERLVKLRNPWGHGEWKGDWGDDSVKWTPELKEALKFEKSEDGVFFMTYNDFVEYYSDCQICYYHDGYKYSAIQIESGFNESIGLSFQIKTEGVYYFSLNQKNRRFFPKSKKYKYSNCTYIVAKLDEDQKPIYVGASIKADKENWIEYQATPGNYIILIKTPWKSFVNEFSFSIYGPSTIDFKKFDPKSKESHLPTTFLKDLFTSHALNDKTEPIYNFASQGYPDIKYKTFDNKGGMGYIFFQNDSKKIEADIVVEMLGSINIQLNDPYSGLRPSLIVKPGTVEIISYEGTKLPYSSQMRLLSTFKDSTKKENIREQVAKSPTVLTKSVEGKTVDIKVFVLYHAKGLAMLYQNNTEEYTITEELEFDLKGCHIDGAYGNYIEVVTAPKSERLLQIVMDSDEVSYEANITKLYYTIK